MNTERTKTGICPGCREVKGVRRDGTMAVHKNDSTRERCAGYGKQHLELITDIHQAEPKFGIQVGMRDMLTHNRGVCAGESCAFHNPSHHHMVTWKMNYRWDTGVLERFCPHDVGHPDPDDTAWHVANGRTWTSVHGCDGCCNPNPEMRRP